jgi:di/tricarboxylate transporter
MENVAILQEHKTKPSVNNNKRTISFAILLLVVGLAASGLLPILISALTGVCLLLLTRCLDLNDVYHRINWQVIFLLAGMIPLGIAMNNTGADKWISDHLLAILSGQSNLVVIGLIFLITMLMSSVVSNNATAIIMTPIAIAVAVGLDLSMKPFILSVLFGANFSFFTPMGYQTNTLIYGMGFYKFKHFVLIGGILSIILWVLGTFMLSTLF